MRGEGHGLAPGHHIRPGGELVLGQEQVSYSYLKTDKRRNGLVVTGFQVAKKAKNNICNNIGCLICEFCS